MSEKKFLRLSASFSSCCPVPDLTPNQVNLVPRQRPAMPLTNRGVSLFLVCVQESQGENNCLFPKRSLLMSTRQDSGVSCPLGSSRMAELCLGDQELRLFCHSTPQPGSVQLGQFCLTAETRLSAWKFTLCELGHWQLNLWVLNSSCSEQRSRLFNLSGFKKSEVFKLLEHIVLPMPAVSG